MKSTKLGTRALAGLVAIVMTTATMGGIDRLAVGYGEARTGSDSAMAHSQAKTTGNAT